MTKREMFANIATINADNAEIVEFCNHEIELLDNRKSSGKRSLTSTQKENVKIKESIKAELAVAEDKLTVSELMKTETLNGYSSQKLSALLRQLVEANEVEKMIEGKKAYFALAEQ